jgi:hypothetical protein
MAFFRAIAKRYANLRIFGRRVQVLLDGLSPVTVSFFELIRLDREFNIKAVFPVPTI